MDRPASTQSAFFATFPHFAFNGSNTTIVEFLRLASHRKWIPGARSQLYEKNWKACFGKNVAVRTPEQLDMQSESEDELTPPSSSDSDDDEIDDLAGGIRGINLTRPQSTTTFAGGVPLSPPLPSPISNAKTKVQPKPRVSLPINTTKAKATPQTQPQPQPKAQQSTKKSRTHSTSQVLAHFNTFYGHNESVLPSWQALCRDCGITQDEVPGSITQCKKVLKTTYINIHDLLHAKLTGQIPRKFKSRAALENYIANVPGMTFPLDKAKQNRFLNVFLVGA